MLASPKGSAIVIFSVLMNECNGEKAVKSVYN